MNYCFGGQNFFPELFSWKYLTGYCTFSVLSLDVSIATRGHNSLRVHPPYFVHQKIQQKVVSDPESFPTLQSIVLHEVETEVSQMRNSATEALLWLKRGLKFLKEFLSEINTGIKDVQRALSKSDDQI